MTNVLVITSCTAQKRFVVDNPLTLSDFLAGSETVRRREVELSDFLLPAEQMYTGQQHLRLMRGVRIARSISSVEVDVWVISAGYGLVQGNQPIAPYEVTFAEVPKRVIRERSDALQIPQRFRELLAGEYDMAVVLLGNDYVEAIDPDQDIHASCPTLMLCSESATTRIGCQEGVYPIPLGRKEAHEFGCGLVGLKGEIAGRILQRIAENAGDLSLVTQSKDQLLRLVQQESLSFYVQPIPISTDWANQSSGRRVKFFIPDWDDLVDPDYDFETDTHSSGSGDWTNEVFAHELYGQPNYDGILVSRVVLEKSTVKRRRIDQLGIHGYLRVPDSYPVMGDCGAFGYINEDVPPYSTEDVLDYYTRYGFNMGVSVDHLIVAATARQRQERYELTIANAEEFLKEHARRSLPWEPVGAVQGWDPVSYAEAARQVAAMGYGYIALGGLVRSSTEEVIGIVECVREQIPSAVKIHLFGLARLPAIRTFADLRVSSVDSASVLRRAWLDARNNYLTEQGWFRAIRIPYAQNGVSARRVVEEGRISGEALRALEVQCLSALRSYASQSKPLSSELVDMLVEYELCFARSHDRDDEGKRQDRFEQIRRTLEVRPWELCSCQICQQVGIDVVLFRGNNRNRRRGFHNTYVFYQLVDRLNRGEELDWIQPPAPRQLSLTQSFANFP